MRYATINSFDFVACACLFQTETGFYPVIEVKTIIPKSRQLFLGFESGFLSGFTMEQIAKMADEHFEFLFYVWVRNVWTASHEVPLNLKYRLEDMFREWEEGDGDEIPDRKTRLQRIMKRYSKRCDELMNLYYRLKEQPPPEDNSTS